MADVVSPEIRSRMMSGIRGRDTKPELAIRRSLHALGFRYRIHGRKLPGRPDLVLVKYQAVIFVNGCFWHGHDCPLFKLPRTRTEFWAEKLGRNCGRDQVNYQKLAEGGWRTAVVWECALKGREGRVELVTAKLADWLKGDADTLEIAR